MHLETGQAYLLFVCSIQALPSGLNETGLQQSCHTAGVKSLLLQQLLGAAIASQVQVLICTAAASAPMHPCTYCLHWETGQAQACSTLLCLD